jgi:hypothetical protein
MENETGDAQQYELKNQLTMYVNPRNAAEIEDLVLTETATNFSAFYLSLKFVSFARHGHCILSWDIESVHTLIFYVLKVHFIIVLPSTQRAEKCDFLLPPPCN